jgi:TIR domain
MWVEAQLVAPRVLFNSKGDIYDYVQGQRDKLKGEYEALPDDKALDETVTRELKVKYMLNVPTLKREQWEADPGPNETVVYVPFEGDADVFNIRPSAIDGTVAVGEISGEHLLVRVPNYGVEERAKRELDKVDSRLRSLRGSVEYLKEQLNIEVAECVMKRKRSVANKASAREALTIPRRQPPPAPPASDPRPVPSQSVPISKEPAPVQETWDIFMSHATPDKPYAKGLVKALREKDITVWFDDDCIALGEPVRQAIKNGLNNSRYGIVVLSKAYLANRKWTEHELDGLFARERLNNFIILPIWHRVDRDEIEKYDAALADRRGSISATDGYDDIVESVLKALGRAAANLKPSEQDYPVTPSKNEDPDRAS